MVSDSTERRRAAVFEEERGRLTGLAYRMLRSQADAEDAVQEAWLRLTRQSFGTIENLAGWLTTVVGRVCIDMLRARAVKAETPFEEDGWGWTVSADRPDAPEASAERADAVGMALMVVLDSLTPDERLAFVLHDVFAVPFAEIAQTLGKSADAAKMLASRARGKVRGAEPPVDHRRQREVVAAFLEAAQEGNFDRLMGLLAPDAVWRVRTPRGVAVRTGAALAASAAKAPRKRFTAELATVNGAPGIVSWREDGRPFAVMACTVEDGLIVAVDGVSDPDRLAAMGLTTRSEW